MAPTHPEVQFPETSIICFNLLHHSAVPPQQAHPYSSSFHRQKGNSSLPEENKEHEVTILFPFPISILLP